VIDDNDEHRWHEKAQRWCNRFGQFVTACNDCGGPLADVDGDGYPWSGPRCPGCELGDEYPYDVDGHAPQEPLNLHQAVIEAEAAATRLAVAHDEFQTDVEHAGDPDMFLIDLVANCNLRKLRSLLCFRCSMVKTSHRQRRRQQLNRRRLQLGRPHQSQSSNLPNPRSRRSRRKRISASAKASSPISTSSGSNPIRTRRTLRKRC
jgi:hypothetical protein